MEEEEKKSVNSSCGKSRLIGLQPVEHSRQVGQGRLDNTLKPSAGGWGVKHKIKIGPAV